MGTNKLVPSLMVFEIIPYFPSTSGAHPAKVDQIRALKLARTEVDTIMAENSIKTALKNYHPSSTHYLLKHGNKVPVYH